MICVSDEFLTRLYGMSWYRLWLVFINSLHSQEIPEDFFEYYLQKYHYNIGNNWELNSTLDPVTYTLYESDILNDSLSIYYRFGNISRLDKNTGFDNAIYFWGKTHINKNIYIFLYPRIVTDHNAFVGSYNSSTGVLTVSDTTSSLENYQLDI